MHAAVFLTENSAGLQQTLQGEREFVQHWKHPIYEPRLFPLTAVKTTITPYRNNVVYLEIFINEFSFYLMFSIFMELATIK